MTALLQPASLPILLPLPLLLRFASLLIPLLLRFASLMIPLPLPLLLPAMINALLLITALLTLNDMLSNPPGRLLLHLITDLSYLRNFPVPLDLCFTLSTLKIPMKFQSIMISTSAALTVIGRQKVI